MATEPFHGSDFRAEPGPDRTWNATGFDSRIGQRRTWVKFDDMDAEDSCREYVARKSRLAAGLPEFAESTRQGSD